MRQSEPGRTRERHPGRQCSVHSVGDRGQGRPWNSRESSGSTEKEHGDKDGPQGVTLRRAWQVSSLGFLLKRHGRKHWKVSRRRASPALV